jgi:hypothetical protein
MYKLEHQLLQECKMLQVLVMTSALLNCRCECSPPQLARFLEVLCTSTAATIVAYMGNRNNAYQQKRHNSGLPHLQFLPCLVRTSTQDKPLLGPSTNHNAQTSRQKITVLNSLNPDLTVLASWQPTVYSQLPLTAGFFCAVDDRGAKVAAVWRVNFVSSLSRLAFGTVPLLLPVRASAHKEVVVSCNRLDYE